MIVIVISYAQENPRRFKKEILRTLVVNAAASRNEEEEFGITLVALEKVLLHIGAVHKMTLEEMEILLQDFGQSGYITPERLIMMI